MPQKRLADKVSGILSRIEAELDAVDEKIGERMHILDLDNDGLVSCVKHHLHYQKSSYMSCLEMTHLLLLLSDAIVLSHTQPTMRRMHECARTAFMAVVFSHSAISII